MIRCRPRRLFPIPALISALLCVLASSSARADTVEACARAAESSQDLRDNDHLVEAREQLQSCARDACPDVIRDDCRTWLVEVERLVPSIVLLANDREGQPVRNVLLRVDGDLAYHALDGKPVDLDPGVHALEFASDGFEPLTMQVVIRTGEKNRQVSVVLERKTAAPAGVSTSPASASTSALSYVLYGVGALALGTGAYLGLDARSDVSEMRDACAPTCSSSDVDQARRQLLFADIALGVGVISVGAATWLLFDRDDAEAVAISAAPGGVSAAWRRRF